MEKPSIRNFAISEPESFLEQFEDAKGVILDEVQNTPQLLSYIQVIVDNNKRNGFFILTGSQNLLLNQSVSQSLAGRVCTLNLLPLTI
mgnify:CR=1 FL=1